MEYVIIIVGLVFAVLQIILFFKVWIMTNNVKTIIDILNSRDTRDAKLPQKAKVKGLDNEVDVVGMKNGKVLCTKGRGMSMEYVSYRLDELIFE